MKVARFNDLEVTTSLPTRSILYTFTVMFKTTFTEGAFYFIMQMVDFLLIYSTFK